MKKNITFILVVFIIGCNNKYIIPHKLINSKYETKTIGVNVRIVNDGQTYFTKIEIKCDSVIYEFCGLKSGQVSGYQNLPYLPKKSSIKVWGFSKHNKYSGYITSVNLDTILIKEGYATIFVKPYFKKNFSNNLETKQWAFSLRIVEDKYPDKISLKLTK